MLNRGLLLNCGTELRVLGIRSGSWSFCSWTKGRSKIAPSCCGWLERLRRLSIENTLRQLLTMCGFEVEVSCSRFRPVTQPLTASLCFENLFSKRRCLSSIYFSSSSSWIDSGLWSWSLLSHWFLLCMDRLSRYWSVVRRLCFLLGLGWDRLNWIEVWRRLPLWDA